MTVADPAPLPCPVPIPRLRPGSLRAAALWAAALLPGFLLLAGGARADGFYLSADYSRTQPQAVLSVERGPLTLSSAVGQGSEGLLWMRSAVLYGRSWRGVRWKVGPSVYAKEWEDWRFLRPETTPTRPVNYRLGLRLAADSYKDRGAWSSFWMVEHDTTQHATLALASGDWKATGLGLELSVWHEAGQKAAPTVLGRWRPPGQDYALRLGWRVKDREAFAGVSFSRFK